MKTDAQKVAEGLGEWPLCEECGEEPCTDVDGLCDCCGDAFAMAAERMEKAGG